MTPFPQEDEILGPLRRHLRGHPEHHAGNASAQQCTGPSAACPVDQLFLKVELWLIAVIRDENRSR